MLGGGHNHYCLVQNSGQLYCANTINGRSIFSEVGYIQTGYWYHLVVGVNTTNYFMYVNDTLIDTELDSTHPTTGVEQILIGTNSDGSQDTDITIDNFYLTSGNYTPDDIYVTFNSGLGCNFSKIETCGVPPVPILPAINVTILTPEDNYGFNATRLAEVGYKIWINTTFNQSNATCSINGTEFSFNSYNSTIEGDGKSKAYFLNNTNLADGIYNYLVNCSDPADSLVNGTHTVHFTIDTSVPEITGDWDLINNKKIVWNHTLVGQLNFSDNLEIYSINVTFYNQTTLYYGSNIGQDNYQLNISYGVDQTVFNNITVEVCDAHTSQTISNIDRVDTVNKGLKFVIEDNPFLAKDKWVSIYPKESSEYINTPMSTKQKDRYTFTFEKATSPKESETFVVESTEYIDISKGQNYGGHLIIPSLNRWIDFENKDATKYEIKRISDNKIEVTVYGLKGKTLKFESIGELNCVERIIKFTNANLQFNNSLPKPVSSSATFTVSYYESNDGEEYLTDFFYNNTEYVVTTGNFINYGSYWQLTDSVTITTPSVVTGNSSLIPFNWNFTTLYDDNYNLSSSHEVYTYRIDNCSSYTTQSLFIDFKNFTGLVPAIVSGSLSVSGSATYSTNFIDINNITLCIYPPYGTLEEDIVVQYTDGGDSFYYESAYSLSNSTQSLTLYIQQDTTTTTFTLKNKDTSELLIDVYASMYRLLEGVWTVVQSKYSDLTGRVQFAFEPDVQYKFFMSKSGYNPYVFYLNPIIFDAYDVLLTQNTTTTTNYDYDGVSLIFAPKLFYNDRTNNFTFIIQSPKGKLETYGYTLTYPSGSSTQSGSTSIGGQLNSSFEITGATFGDRLKVDYYFSTDTGGLRQFVDYYEIMISPSNTSMMHNKDETYGLGLFERTLIAVFIALLVVGIGSLIGQPIPSFALSLFILGYMSYIGFLPWWSIGFTVIFGVISLSLKGD